MPQKRLPIVLQRPYQALVYARLFRSNVLLEERCALAWHSKSSHLIGLDMTFTDTAELSTTSSSILNPGCHVLEKHHSIGKDFKRIQQ